VPRRPDDADAALGAVTAPGAGTPLARLLAIAYRTLIDDLHLELRRRGWLDVRPAYGFVLLAARDTTTAGALADSMGMTKQASSKLVDAMVSAGYVRRGGGDGDARRKKVHLTARGQRLLREVETIYRELEQGWAEVIGADRLEQLRADLTAILTGSGSRVLPPVRPLW
jgi:DNA-binding MarR family transcriptional regulator